MRPVLVSLALLLAPCLAAGAGAVASGDSAGRVTQVFHVPVTEAGTHLYFHDLLRQSLEATGHKVRVKGLEEIPHKRAWRMLEQGDLTLNWMLRTAERDERFVPVPVNLTGGLISHRVLLIPPGTAQDYANVRNVDEFRDLGKVGAFAEGWFDTTVWRYNTLPFIVETGNWKNIFRKLRARTRTIDYFSRGVIEIVPEHKVYSDLEIEPRLLFSYERDFRYYLSPKNEELAPLLTDALEQARQSGLMDRLIDNHWGDEIESLRMNERVHIRLATPPFGITQADGGRR